MSEFKQIFIAIIKAPTFIPLLITLLVANQKWLLPQIPDEVVNSFLNFLTVILVAVSGYYAGKTVQEQDYKRAALAKLPKPLHINTVNVDVPKPEKSMLYE